MSLPFKRKIELSLHQNSFSLLEEEEEIDLSLQQWNCQ